MMHNYINPETRKYTHADVGFFSVVPSLGKYNVGGVLAPRGAPREKAVALRHLSPVRKGKVFPAKATVEVLLDVEIVQDWLRAKNVNKQRIMLFIFCTFPLCGSVLFLHFLPQASRTQSPTPY